MNNVLKPCPFCGGEACIKTSTTQTIPSHPMAWVYCKKCKSSSASFDDFKKNGTFLFDAIDAWNSRFDDQNKILDEHNVILAKLLELLEGKK